MKQQPRVNIHAGSAKSTNVFSYSEYGVAMNKIYASLNLRLNKIEEL
jgi:hypothetical protein